MSSSSRLSSLSLAVILPIFLLLITTALSCSTTQFSSIYSSYPECAASCLACPDADYTTNFAHTCDYQSGACCMSRFHDSIASTWECARRSCGQDQAQAAFDVFWKFCQDKEKSLAAADVPAGFVVNNNSSSSNNTSSASDDSSGKKLSASEIAGIVVGVAGFFATALGTYYGYRAIRRRRASGAAAGGTGDDTQPTANQMQLSHWPERKYDLSNVSLAPGHTVRFSISNSNVTLNGIQRYQETWELRRDADGNTAGGRVQAGRVYQGRILGEV